MIARLVTRVVDTRHRPGVGTVRATVNRLTGAREVRVHLVDAARPDEWLWVPAAVVRLLDGCTSCAEVRALLGTHAAASVALASLTADEWSALSPREISTLIIGAA